MSTDDHRSDERPGRRAARPPEVANSGPYPAVPELDTVRGAPEGDPSLAPVYRRHSGEHRLAAVVEGMSEAFLSLDTNWRVTYANREACRLNRTTRAELLGRNHWERWPETAGTEVERQYRRVVDEGISVRFDHYYPDADAWHAIQAYPAEGGGVAVFYRDITADKRADEERERLLAATRAARAEAERAATRLEASEARFRALIEYASDAITVVDREGLIRYASPSYDRVYGLRPERRVGQSAFDRLHPDDRGIVINTFRRLLETPDGTATAEFRARHEDGSWRHISAVARNRLDDPLVGGVIINSRDVTEREQADQALRESEARFRHQALHDPLTGLANRTLFADRVAHALARAARDGTAAAVLFLDLDGFKALNDTLGHDAGDECLRIAADRLLHAVRADDTVARLGGDEFAVLLEGTHIAHAESEAVEVAERAVAALGAPVDLGGRECPISASIGIAAAGGTASPGELLRLADGAMYTAKARGGGQHAVARRASAAPDDRDDGA